MDWRCGSSIEHLLCKCKALSSNPGPTKKKKKKAAKLHWTLMVDTCHLSYSGDISIRAISSKTRGPA
jgi:hypothetical protein